MVTETRSFRPSQATVQCGRWRRMLLGAACAAALGGVAFAGDVELQLASFRADLTPPIGEDACIGFMPNVSRVEHPLEMRGIVLRKVHGSRSDVYVVAALDDNGVCNSSDDLFRRRMADAAGTTPDRVALQSLHQHTAPESFVCVAGYGECGVWYFGPDSIFSDRGGYRL